MTVDEMQDTLYRLGVDVVSVRGYEIQCYCPVHKLIKGVEDRNPSFWINADTGANLCFSCGHKGALTTLVSMIQGSDYDAAKAFITSGDVNLTNSLQKALKPKEIFEQPTFITESMLSAFVRPPVDALKSRGLTVSAAVKHDLLWDERRSNWITVIREPSTGKLLGWQEKGHRARYFKNQPVGVQKSTTLFGYNQYKGGTMIVVESPLDVVRLDSVGITGGVATYGSAVSRVQFNLIRGAEKVVFAMDNDDSGKGSSLSLLTLATEMGLECWFFNYTSTGMKDVGGMSKAEIEWGLDNAKHCVHGEKALS
jgi:DNA primase